MGAVELRIAPEASPFRDDADFDGPGAWKNHFFGNMVQDSICQKYVRHFKENVRFRPLKP